MGARGLVIRNDIGVAELRRFAQGEADRRAALRALAIAQALEGASRADAARVVGRERQSLRDAVLRYNGAHHKAGANGVMGGGAGGKANERFFALMLLGTVPLPPAADPR